MNKTSEGVGIGLVIILIVGFVGLGANSLLKNSQEVNNTTQPTITPVPTYDGPQNTQLQLRTFTLPTIPPTPTPTSIPPTLPPTVPTATPTPKPSTCTALISGSYGGSGYLGPGMQDPFSASVNINYDPSSPSTSSYSYSWHQPSGVGSAGACNGASETANTGSIVETYNGSCSPSSEHPGGLSFTLSGTTTFEGSCYNAFYTINPITFCAVPPTAATSYKLAGQTADQYIPPLGDPIQITTGQPGWQWYPTDYHAPASNGSSPTYNPSGNYNFTFQPSASCNN